MEFENYPLPPIQEAILDIDATVPESTTIASLEEYGKAVEKVFPEKRPRIQFSSNIKVNFEDAAGSRSDYTTNQTGWIFRTPTKDKAVQPRLNGFTFNRLPVYEGWEKFISEAKSLWAEYRTCVKPKAVTSIGLRYINRLKLPFPLVDFQSYCVLFPKAAPHHPKALNEFFLRYGGKSASITGATTAVTVTFQKPEFKLGYIPVLVDIHVVHAFPAPLECEHESLWKTFELLRIEKNLVFESSITDKARELFRK